MAVDIDKLSNILGQDTIKQIYEDGPSKTVQEVGKTSVDLIKALRLFTAPLQLMAAWQDRLVKYLDRVRDSVPEENQIEAPSSISGPVLEKLKYVEENSVIQDLYLELLSRAINKERIHEAHPAFPQVISQISPDEALILYWLKNGSAKIDYTMDLAKDQNGDWKWVNSTIITANYSFEKLNFPQHWSLYLSHLESLNLVFWQMAGQETAIKKYDELEGKEVQTGTRKPTIVGLTKFGNLFVSACIPEKGIEWPK